MKFGALLRRERKVAGLTLRQAASIIDCSFVYFQQVEKGARAPFRRATTEAFCAAIGIKPDALLAAAAKHRGVNDLPIVDGRPDLNFLGTLLMNDWERLTPDQVRALRDTFWAVTSPVDGVAVK